MARLAGRFILSINDVPAIRELFGRFALQAVEVDYSVMGGKPKAARELIIQTPIKPPRPSVAP